MKTLPGIRVVLCSLALVIVPVTPALAGQCSMRYVKLGLDQSVDYVLEACPSATGTEFEIVNQGDGAVAKIVLREIQEDDGHFTITSVAPGETTMRLRWTHPTPRHMGTCVLTVTVTES